MDSQIYKRSVSLGGRKTSVSLEDDFWTALKNIAAARRMVTADLVREIDSTRGQANLSSCLRVHVLNYFKRQAAPPSAKETKSVLVVDDEPMVLALTAGMLEELGCNAITAPNGAEALARLAEGDRPDDPRLGTSWEADRTHWVDLDTVAGKRLHPGLRHDWPMLLDVLERSEGRSA